MTEWQEVRRAKEDMLKRCFADLNVEEQKIMVETLRLEIDNRHMKAPRIRRPLREFIDHVVRSDS